MTVTDWKNDRLLGWFGAWPAGGVRIWSRPPEDTAESRSGKDGNQEINWHTGEKKSTSLSWKIKFSPTSVFSGPLLWTSLWTLFPDIIKLQRIYKKDDTVTRHVARERKVWKSEYLIYFWKWSPAVEWRAGWLMRREAIISGFSRRPWWGSSWVTFRRFEHKISQGVPTGPPFTPLCSVLRWWQQGNTWEITET